MRTDSDLIADIATRLEITETDVNLCYKEVSHVYGKKVTYSDILKVVYKLPEVIKRTPSVADVVGTFEVYKRRELPERQRQEAERQKRKAERKRREEVAQNDRASAHAKELAMARLAREVAKRKQQKEDVRSSITCAFFDNPSLSVLEVYERILSSGGKRLIRQICSVERGSGGTTDKLMGVLYKFRAEARLSLRYEPAPTQTTQAPTPTKTSKRVFYGSVSPRDFGNPTHRRW